MMLIHCVTLLLSLSLAVSPTPVSLSAQDDATSLLRNRRSMTCSPTQVLLFQGDPVDIRTHCHGKSDPLLCSHLTRSQCCVGGALDICLVLCETCPKTFAPTLSPSVLPTAFPTTSTPTESPTQSPTTSLPTISPTQTPTISAPTISPTMSPTTSTPTTAPTLSPTASNPTQLPSSASPTHSPSVSPSTSPTMFPSLVPSQFPTLHPSTSPTNFPTTNSPTLSPTALPTISTPTLSPSSSSPTTSPTQSPTGSQPTLAPSTSYPTALPTLSSPTTSPSTSQPTAFPTVSPVPSLCIDFAPLDVVIAYVTDNTDNVLTVPREDADAILHLAQLLPIAPNNVRLGWVSNLASSSDTSFVVGQADNKLHTLSKLAMAVHATTAISSSANLSDVVDKAETLLRSRVPQPGAPTSAPIVVSTFIDCDGSLDAPFCVNPAYTAMCGFVNGVVLVACPFACGVCTVAPTPSPSPSPTTSFPSTAPTPATSPPTPSPVSVPCEDDEFCSEFIGADCSTNEHIRRLCPKHCGVCGVTTESTTTVSAPVTDPFVCRLFSYADCLENPATALQCPITCSTSSPSMTPTASSPTTSPTTTSPSMSPTATTTTAPTATPSAVVTQCEGEEDPVFCDNFKTSVGCNALEVGDSVYCPIFHAIDCTGLATSTSTKLLGEFALEHCPVLCNTCGRVPTLATTSTSALPTVVATPVSSTSWSSWSSSSSPSASPTSTLCHDKKDAQFCGDLTADWCDRHSAIAPTCPILCDACPSTTAPTTTPTARPTEEQLCNGKPDEDVCYDFFAKNTTFYCSQLEVINECPVLCGFCKHPDNQDPDVACAFDDPLFCAAVGVCNPADTALFNLCFKLCGRCAPTTSPTQLPTPLPSTPPTSVPTTSTPSVQPTELPTGIPTAQPTMVPTTTPTAIPTATPTRLPTQSPSTPPTGLPSSSSPTHHPTTVPTSNPTAFPTRTPSNIPTTATPTSSPTSSPTLYRTCVNTVLDPVIYAIDNSKRRCRCGAHCNTCEHDGLNMGRCLKCKDSKVLDTSTGVCFDNHFCSSVSGLGEVGLVCDGDRDNALVVLVTRAEVDATTTSAITQRLRLLGIGVWELVLSSLTSHGGSQQLDASVEANVCSRQDGGSITNNCDSCCGGSTESGAVCICGDDCHTCDLADDNNTDDYNTTTTTTTTTTFGECTRCARGKVLFNRTCIADTVCLDNGYTVKGVGYYGRECACHASPDNDDAFNNAIAAHAQVHNGGYYMAGPCSSFQRFCQGDGNVAQALTMFCKATCDLCNI